MNAVLAKKYTPDDLLTMPDDGIAYELVNGDLVEKSVSFESDLIGGEVFSKLKAFTATNPVGRAIPETTYQCFADEPDRVRRPDASFIRTERMPSILPRGHCRIAPDMAAEVVSPNDVYEDVEARVREFFAAGTKLIWVVLPRQRTVRVFRTDGTITDVGPTGTLSGEDVIPGFSCPVADLFASVQSM
jgi:Uma2 family endonuclease